MSKKMRNLVTICSLLGLITLATNTAQADWEETFNNNSFDLPTWQFHCYPDMAKTFTATIQDGPDDNDYLAIAETTSVGVMPPGSAFGGGFGSNEDFTDVRVGAVVNVEGNVSQIFHVLSGRSEWINDPDASHPGNPEGAPGVLVSSYVLLTHWEWENGPANLILETQKIIYLGNIMEIEYEVEVPGLMPFRSYYAELDIVGSDPVYITGSLYEYKGGPLVARVPTFIDTSAQDPWEEPGLPEQVYPPFAAGVTFIGGMNEDEEPVGYYTTFDDVFSTSHGPAAVNLSPAVGATGVSTDIVLNWVEAEFATSRELWLGKAGAMEKVEPAPTGTTYTAGNLEFGQTYQWRVDQIGPLGTVTGHTWSFTTAECMSVDDFESYANNAGIQAVWIDSVPDYDYVFLATEDEGNKSMQFQFENQYPPYVTEATRTFSDPQDWTAQDVKALSLYFYGENDNVEHPMYLKLEDTYGNNGKVEHPYPHAV
ncbi:MAG: hypothetical protein ACYTFW_11505, partial [Planctomycetota bacterium]